MIGDVSGKGLPGSLFMAISKALYKSTALRRHGQVAVMMREADAEISRDNAEGLFVTVLAGILDARTGELEYCSAGHEPPLLLPRDGRALLRLDEGGGPPLCAVDGFPYVPATRRLEPGDTLCLITDGITEAAVPTASSTGGSGSTPCWRASAGRRARPRWARRSAATWPPSPAAPSRQTTWRS